MLSHHEINTAAKLIIEGRLVAFPTETVYGLGADVFNAHAVARIFEIKQRPSFDPLIVHIASLKDISLLTSDNDPRIHQLANVFWPGPLTIVLPKTNRVPDIVTAGLPTVAIRMPGHLVALELIKKAKRPIAAPSANKFGKVSPTSAEHVRKHLPEVDFILDAGRTTIGIESTVIRLRQTGFQILRHGAVTTQELEQVLPNAQPTSQNEPVAAPGMLNTHYSPDKPFYLANNPVVRTLNRQKGGLLSFSGRDAEGYQTMVMVTESLDLKEYAVNMFAAMHQMQDDPVIDYIVAEPVPETGIGMAIMDRLRKAANQANNSMFPPV
jgi:L-threonylcarbamoyladenylate synthase